MSEERNARKVQIGKVVSDKMDKTIVVAVETYKNTTCTINVSSTLKSSKRMTKKTLRKSVTR